jgi:serine/threonine-protein kinase
LSAAAHHLPEVSVRVGDRLGEHYRVTRVIGRGGMGVVVEAVHEQHGARVAVKVLHPKHLENKEAVARFLHEGKAASQVRGEFAARVYDMGMQGSSPYLVMELLHGEDLGAVLERGRVLLELAALYILQACEGMAEVHAHGMVHRDLKPSNLFLTARPDGSPLIKVLDFGIAKGVAVDASLPALTQTLVGLGTPLYMSPEQIRSSREVDARADVWSLGAIFYELVSGKPAFGGATVTQITAQVLESDPPALTDLDPSLPKAADAIVAAALQKNPDARAVDVAVLAALVEPLAGPAGAGAAQRCAKILAGAMRPDLATTPPVARDDPAGGTRRFDRQKRTRRARALVGLLGVAALSLTAAAAGVYLDGSRGRPVETARRGIEMQTTRAALIVASRADGGDVQRATGGTPPVVLSAAPSAALPGPTDRPHGASAGGAPATPTPSAPTSKPGNVSPTAKAWNPFDERN